MNTLRRRILRGLPPDLVISKTPIKTPIQINGETYPSLKAACRGLNLSYSNVYNQIKTNGLTQEQAIHMFLNKGPSAITIDGQRYASVSDACKAYGMSRTLVYKRMSRFGVSLEEALAMGKIHNHPRNPWTPEEDEILKAYWATEGQNVAARLPRHTPLSCKSHAKLIGLK